jgi:ABC-type Mn2+/Zn2+ transport systems, permease components
LAILLKISFLGEDTAIGIIFSSFFALGFVLISVLDVTINLEDLLFGQILAVSTFDTYIVGSLLFIVLSVLIIFFKQLLFFSFDPIGAEVNGLNTTFLNYLFLIVLSVAIVGSLQTVGIILVLSMLIIPAAAAKLVTKTFVNSIRISIVFGVTASVTGLYLSYFFNLPSGPTMSLVATGIFILAYVSNRLINKNTANLVPIEEET